MTIEQAAEILRTYNLWRKAAEAIDFAIEALRESEEPPAIDDLPIEDVAIIEMWLESLRMSPSVQSITIRLSDGEILYTVKNERP